MNKKISSEFAIGIVLLLAITVGGIIWMLGNKQLAENQQISQVVPIIKSKQKSQETKTIPAIQSEADLCKPHYYEGESKVQVWLLSTGQGNDSSMVVQLKNGEEKKLPIKDVVKNTNFTVKLIDPTAGVRKGLLASSKERPVSLVIRGYAEICEQPPLVSLQNATVAFKKS